MTKVTPRERAVTPPNDRGRLSVYDGADRVGSLVERAGTYDAYDLSGRKLGAFPDMRAAARSIPPCTERKRPD